MALIVCMGASRIARMMPEYIWQLSTKGIPAYVEPLEIKSHLDGTMGLCLHLWRKFATMWKEYDRIVVTDAFDVLCFGNAEEIEAKIPEHPVLAAERNSYPEQIQVDETLPWKYVNGGMLAGSPRGIMSFCEDIESHPDYDPNMVGQQWLNRRLAEDWWAVRLDTYTHLFYCMVRDNEDYPIAQKNGRPMNSATCEQPNFIHFNGSWPDQPFRDMLANNAETPAYR